MKKPMRKATPARIVDMPRAVDDDVLVVLFALKSGASLAQAAAPSYRNRKAVSAMRQAVFAADANYSGEPEARLRRAYWP